MATEVASHLVDSCLLHISKISGVGRKKAEYRSFLVHEFGRFRLWGHGFDASLSKSDESGELDVDESPGAVGDQLDEVLERSKYLKETTILLLSSFASCVLTKHFKRSMAMALSHLQTIILSLTTIFVIVMQSAMMQPAISSKMRSKAPSVSTRI